MVILGAPKGRIPWNKGKTMEEDSRIKSSKKYNPIDKDWLEEQYIKLGRNTNDIATELGYSSGFVYSYIKKYGIPTRSISEGLKGIKRSDDVKKAISLRMRGPNYIDPEMRTTVKDNPKCPTYLGIYVAERVLSKIFSNVTRMPIGNPGYDFLCSKGYKIDVKSSCLHEGKYEKCWRFYVGKNTIADYFLCLSFDNRNDLNPLHIWLIPGNIVNDHMIFQISSNQKGLNKWKSYERPIDKVVSCCNILKNKSEDINHD